VTPGSSSIATTRSMLGWEDRAQAHPVATPMKATSRGRMERERKLALAAMHRRPRFEPSV
jgi:hypothetical protein